MKISERGKSNAEDALSAFIHRTHSSLGTVCFLLLACIWLLVSWQIGLTGNTFLARPADWSCRLDDGDQLVGGNCSLLAEGECTVVPGDRTVAQQVEKKKKPPFVALRKANYKLKEFNFNFSGNEFRIEV